MGMSTVAPARTEWNSATQHTGGDLLAPVKNIYTVVPPADTQGIFFGLFGQAVFSSPYNITGGGHTVGVMGWGVNVNSGTVAMGIGVEGRYDHTNGGQGAGTTTTQAKAVLGLINNAIGTMTHAKGVSSEVSNLATVGTAYGVHASVTANIGTIGKWIGFAMPNMQGVVAGITEKRFLENLDPAAPSTSIAPIIDQAYGYSQPATGFSLQIPDHINDWQFLPAGTLAAGTVILPPVASVIDGFELCIGSTQTITSLTVNGNGATVFNAPTTLSAGGSFRLKFFGRGINIWVRR